MDIEITIRSIIKRPSGHGLSPFFGGGIDYKEKFSCKKAKSHAELLMKVLDLVALDCGIESGEFPRDPFFTENWKRISEEIKNLHAVSPKQKLKS